MQARQEEAAQAQERYIHHKRRIMLYDHLAEQESDSSDSESNDGSQNSQHEVEESVSTPSESSVVTPNDTPSAFPKSNMGALDAAALLLKPQLHLVLPDTPVDNARPLVHQPSPAPKLQASLVALSDFTYDRFSMILDSPVPVASPAQSISTPDLEFDDYSPPGGDSHSHFHNPAEIPPLRDSNFGSIQQEEADTYCPEPACTRAHCL